MTKYLCNVNIDFMDGTHGTAGHTVDIDPAKVTDLADLEATIIDGKPAILSMDKVQQTADGLAAGASVMGEIVEQATALNDTLSQISGKSWKASKASKVPDDAPPQEGVTDDQS